MSDVLRWTLIDVSSRIWKETFELTSDHVRGQAKGAPWSIRKRTLRGGLADGVDLVEVDNGALSFTVLPSRGMGLWCGSYNGHAVGWRSPVSGPVNPRFVNLLDQGGLGWLKGFDEWVVRCGLDSNGPPCTDIVPDNNGNPSEVQLTLHGRIANLPACKLEVQVVRGEQTELVVTGVVEEAMLFCPQLRLETSIRTVIGSNTVTIRDEVTNFRQVACEMELLYHCNYGMPFLESGAKLVSPSVEVAPRDGRASEGIASYDLYGSPVPGFVEQAYWHDMAADADGNTLAMLRNRVGNLGAVVRWNREQMPCFTQWKNTVGEREGYVTGLEPGTNLPNPKTFERASGRVVVLQPDETYGVDLAFEFHDTADGVKSVEAEVGKLTEGCSRVVHDRPVEKWSVL